MRLVEVEVWMLAAAQSEALPSTAFVLWCQKLHHDKPQT